MNFIKLIYLSVFCGVISILSFFNIIYSYYLNSRSRYSPTELEIYTQIGAYRGEANYFLSFINYRVSSIFVEPLSLAYFSIICLGFYRALSAEENFILEFKRNFWRYLIILGLII